MDLTFQKGYDMDIQTRLSLLDQHLSLLIESTENCDTLTGVHHGEQVTLPIDLIGD